MLLYILYGFAALLGVGIIIVGARFLLVPEASAAGYGVAVTARTGLGAYLAVKGVRDIASGLVVFPVLVLGEPQVLGWVLLAAACTPIADAAIVLRWGGSPALAYGMHGGTAAVMVALSACLLLM